MEHAHPAFGEKRATQKILPESSESQVPLDHNNLYPKVVYLGMSYADPL